jgi:hypothetical protein
MDRDVFKSAFQDRLDCFVSSIQAMCSGKNVSWQVYRCDPELGEDGFVNMLAKPESPESISNDTAELINYISFLMKQGFRIEMVIDWTISNLSIKLTAWENDDEPEWDEFTKSDFVLRWNGVKGPASLGLGG